jgi:DNA-directed RNA polymerase specialized sigma24 family protein
MSGSGGRHRDRLFRQLCGRLGYAAADLTHAAFLRIIVSGSLPSAGQSLAFLLQLAKGLRVDLDRQHGQGRLDSVAANSKSTNALFDGHARQHGESRHNIAKICD